MTGGPALLELRIHPSIELISIVRRFVSAFYDEIVSDPDATSRVALATHELLENAVKYSTDDETTLRIDVAPRGTEHIVSVRITNRTSEKNIARLESLFREMREANGPSSFYQEAMQKSTRRREGSGLGLARIEAEAEMTLGYEVSDGQVCISAQGAVKLRDGWLHPGGGGAGLDAP